MRHGNGMLCVNRPSIDSAAVNSIQDVNYASQESAVISRVKPTTSMKDIGTGFASQLEYHAFILL